MNRRTFIQLGLAATAGALLPSSIAAASAPSLKSKSKRGLGLTTRAENQWREKVEASGASWVYTWSNNVPQNIPPGVEFIPMVFGRLSDEKFVQTRATFREHGFKELLGFNEPDGKEQGNLKVEDALALWPKLMELAPRLGSPACIHPDNDWMKSFMNGVKERSLRVDFVTVHSYGGLNADALMKQLEAVHDLFQRPIWVTEFAVGDWKAKTIAENHYRPEQIVKFMEEILPRLDQCDFVERYAWFSPKPDNRALGPCALFNDDGSLTSVGKAYRTL